jgi:hypothetical protein
MCEDKTIIEWNFGGSEMPLGVPLILCVHELDNASKCYVEGPITAIMPRDGRLQFLRSDNKPLSCIRIYAWALWPEPLKLELKRRI